jgi:hypothetical protein
MIYEWVKRRVIVNRADNPYGQKMGKILRGGKVNCRANLRNNESSWVNFKNPP